MSEDFSSAHVSFGNSYSKIYDLVYASKPYLSEVEFIFSLSKPPSEVTSVLDLGCGSGRHLECAVELMASEGRTVGVDLSPDMCRLAEDRVPDSTIICSAIQDYSAAAQFDLVYSVFHVINYITAEVEVSHFFTTIARSLKDDGVAIIDFWNRAAWNLTPPSVRVRKFDDRNGGKLIRCVVPAFIDLQLGLVSLEIDNFVPIGQGEYENISETHVMRAYSALELSLIAEQNGLTVTGVGAWNSQNPLTPNDWAGWMSFVLK